MAPETRSQRSREIAATNESSLSTAASDQQQQANIIAFRQTASTQFARNEPDRPQSRQSRRSNRSNAPDEPARFVIDLSLPPEQRYLEVCNAFKEEMLNLTCLFDEVVGGMVHFIPLKLLRLSCKVLLRGVHNTEENAELKGISKATGVDMYLLVCFNVLLDLFMGCSSGGAPVHAGVDGSSGTKMVHFRTLDWGMPALRRVIVHLDYVLQKDGPVIASSVTYAGYVGVLTGVRKGLSMSLNFRPNRIDNGKFWPDVKYAWHHIMVLLGRRASISSTLRRFLLPQRRKKRPLSWLFFTKDDGIAMTSYSEIVRWIAGELGKARPITTTACYLCFCDGKETTVIEKDRVSAKARTSDDFILVTNCDDEYDTTSNLESNDSLTKKSGPILDADLNEVIEEAKDRQECARENWAGMRAAKMTNTESVPLGSEDSMEIDDVVEMVQRYPTTNECTHFACVMDPAEGHISWCRRWMKPISARWITEHSSNAFL